MSWNLLEFLSKDPNKIFSNDKGRIHKGPLNFANFHKDVIFYDCYDFQNMLN